MPTFCRHNRFLQNCPICREPEAPRRRAAAPAPVRARSGSSGVRRAATGVRVRHLARAAEDGYASSLVPGLRATADAERLADELAFAAGRLAELATAPPDPFAEAASAPDRDEGIWLAAQLVLLGPDDVGEAVTPWAGARGGSPATAGSDAALDGLALGPRSPFADVPAAARGRAALRSWMRRQGGPAAALAGDPTWTPERRFARLFERLGTVAGLGRARYDLLAVLGAVGLADVEPDALHAGDRDDATLAAKRAFGIGDRLLLDRRAAGLAAAAGVAIGALDLALVNLDRPANARLTLGASPTAADPEVRDRAAAALGVG